MRSCHISLILIATLYHSECAYGEETFSGVYGASVREYLNNNYKLDIDYLTNTDRTGKIFTTGLFRNAVRINIRNQDGLPLLSCSGVLISKTWVLTAAHCFCGTQSTSPQDYKSCLPQLSSITASIFSPVYGIAKMQGAPSIHDEYKSPQSATPASGENFADLALIKLSTEFPATPLSLEEGYGDLMLASFGASSITNDNSAKAFGAPGSTEIQSGLAQVAKYKNYYEGKSFCLDLYSDDTICTLYSDLPYPSGPLQSAVLCQGDSGSPLFQMGSNNNIVLVGIASFYSPKSSAFCATSSSHLNHFIKVSMYRSWIIDTIGQQESSEISASESCQNGIFKNSEINLLNFDGSLSITAAKPLVGDLGPNDFDRPEITTNATSCEYDKEFGVISCKVSKDAFIVSSVSNGYGQWTICQK